MRLLLDVAQRLLKISDPARHSAQKDGRRCVELILGGSPAGIMAAAHHGKPWDHCSTTAMHSISIFKPKLNCAPQTVRAGGFSGKNFLNTLLTFGNSSMS
jgi:hypothetical protein